MKTILLTIGLLSTQMTFASTTEKFITVAQFKKQVREEINSTQIENGELEDLGGDCSLSVKIDDKNRSFIVISSENKVRLALMINEKEKIKEIVDDVSDDTYRKIYKFGLTKTLEIIHADDAYDAAVLSSGSTKLTCSVYF